MQLVRDLQVTAMAHTTVDFNSSGWTQIDLGGIGPNLTVNQPGQDVQSVMIENKYTSPSSVHFVFKADPGDAVAASHGFEIEAGGVFQEGTVKNIRYVSIRGATGSGTVKVILRSFRTADQAPWED